MAKNKRTALEIQRDRAEISSLYIRGWLQKDIADKMGMMQQMVSYDITAVQKRWREDTTRDLDADKAEQLARIDVVEREAWKAWERSCEEREVSETSQSEVHGDTRTRKSIRKQQRERFFHHRLEIAESSLGAGEG